ncbi:hypothetical protein IAD21_01182 [Abditibacteriota bacterium]|nr:hypothetical protein IAD21_01182 [Abditibacteriota bacterium]
MFLARGEMIASKLKHLSPLSTHLFMQKNKRKPRLLLPLMSILSVMTCLGLVALASAAPRPTQRVATKKSLPLTIPSPVSLGNGIFLLGEDTGSSPSLVPKPPSARRRDSSQARPPQVNLNVSLVQFCRAYLGHKLGNGQCSELAMLGLPTVGAQMDINNQWGAPVCNYSATGGKRYIQLGQAGSVRGNPRKVNVKPGDIIQYESVKFERRWNGGYSFREYPHHTSVIEQVSRDGNTLKVLEQNVNNTQFVVETVLYLPDQTEGIMHITRPIPR